MQPEHGLAIDPEAETRRITAFIAHAVYRIPPGDNT